MSLPSPIPPELLAQLEARREEVREDEIATIEREWAELSGKMKAHRDAGTDPTDPLCDDAGASSLACQAGLSGVQETVKVVRMVAGFSPLPTGLHQPGLVGIDHGLNTIAQAQLRQHAGDMGFDRALADEQLGRELRVAQSGGQHPQHLDLAFG